MSARQDFKLEGVADLKKALAALDTEVATKAGVTATRKTANLVRDALREAAPYHASDTKRTWRTKDGEVQEADYGHLRDNIASRKTRSKLAHTVSYVVTTGNAFWGRFLEFGTSKMAAQPWFKPALDRVAPEAIKTIVSELKIAVDRAARKAGKR